MRRLAKASALAVGLQVSAAIAQSEQALPQSETARLPPEGDLLRLTGQPEAELLVNVELTGNDPSARYEIRSTLSDAVLLACHDTCKFRIWPGRYRLITLSSHGRVQGEEPLLVDQDSRISVKSAPLFEPILGAVLIAAGSAAGFLGGYYFKQSDCSETCSQNTARDNRMGVGFMLGGAITIPVGVLLLSNGLEPEVTLFPAEVTLDAQVKPFVRASVHRVSWSLAF